MTKYQLTIHAIADANDSGITIPFDSEDSTLDIAQRVIAAINQKRRGPRKGAKAATETGK